MATVQKAKVVRGVYIRGVAHAEGVVGSVSDQGTRQPGDSFVISHQEFNEMKASNYVVAHVEPAAPEPVVPQFQAEEVAVPLYSDGAKKAGK